MSKSTSAGLSGRQKKQSSRYSGEDSEHASLQALIYASARVEVSNYAMMISLKEAYL